MDQEAKFIIDQEMKELIGLLIDLRAPLPFDNKALLAILNRQTEEGWDHPLANLAVALVTHHHIAIEPLMLSRHNTKREKVGDFNFSCCCFYGTVNFSSLGIMVYSNHGEGGMCAETPTNLIAVHPMPTCLREMMPKLLDIADQMIGKVASDFCTPKAHNLKWIAKDLGTLELSCGN